MFKENGMKRYLLLLCAWYCIINMHLISAQRTSDNMHHVHDVLVELNDTTVKTIIDLEHLLPNYPWSKEFRNLSHDVHDEATVASYSIVKAVIDECLTSCTHLPHHQATPIRAALEDYNHLLRTGKAQINSDDLEASDYNLPLRKVKKICRLCVAYLNVTKQLFVNGNEITGNSQSSFSPAYGQLSVSSQEIAFYNPEEWRSIPFNGTGPTSEMGVSTTSPATITIQHDGVYQINFSLYFSVDRSNEDTFTITTYTFGLNVNGVTTPAAAVYVGETGTFSLNYSSIMELAVNDQVQFYLEASAAEGPTFTNNVTLENGHAHLIQISN